MDNYAIADQFSLLSKLLDIHGDNSFKSKTYAAAAFNIEKLPEPLANTPRDSVSRIRGIGESVAKKVFELLDTGEMQSLKEFLANTPPGVVEMLQIKGIGPKKIHTIWKEMGIDSIGELQYACGENRLTRFKGFGEKTQQNVLESINFYLNHQGHFLYAQVAEVFPMIDGYLKKIFPEDKVSVTGAFRRQELTLQELEYVIAQDKETIKPRMVSANPPELLEENDNSMVYLLKNGLKLRFYHGETALGQTLMETTGPLSFTDAFKKKFAAAFSKTNGQETEIFSAAGIPFIEPCLRHQPDILEKAAKKKLPLLIQATDVKGLIHSHSKWSDGANTLEEMAEELIRRGFEYMVISDHSKSAFYANGLSEERIREQFRQIDELNARYKPFRIFKSIECDILNDGSLDYSNEMLATFDLVIASVHSNLSMSEEKAMARILRAVENPYTTILGHPTGRLLLSRNGYPVDHSRLIDACAKHQVVIELNAHPRRLDMDGAFIPEALEKNVLISIDPDAHALEGFDDIRFGVLAAQRGGLTAAQNLSSFTLNEFETFLAARRKAKGI